MKKLWVKVEKVLENESHRGRGLMHLNPIPSIAWPDFGLVRQLDEAR